jgi:hypothetical protein
MKLRIKPTPINEQIPFAWPVEIIIPPEYDPADLELPHYSTSAEHLRSIATIQCKHNLRTEIVRCLTNNSEVFEQLYQFSFWKQFDTIAEWYDHHIIEKITVVEDKPGYYMDQHVDNRVVFGAIICNLQPNPPGTKFQQLNYQLPGTKDQGVFYLNHDVNQHSITMTGNKFRVTLQILLCLKQLSIEGPFG